MTYQKVILPSGLSMTGAIGLMNSATGVLMDDKVVRVDRYIQETKN